MWFSAVLVLMISSSMTESHLSLLCFILFTLQPSKSTTVFSFLFNSLMLCTYSSIQDMFSAGSETSATVVEWVMSEILKNPKLMKKAQNEVRHVFDGKGVVNEARIHELKFLRSIVKETLRLHPPAPLISRECRENCVINGYDIPAKTKLIVNAWSLGRDPCYWKEAEEFRPERFLDSSIDFRGTNFEYIPFGARRRICPGISFALPSIELPLANLLYHFDWKLPNGMKFEDLEMTESFGLTVRRKNDLFLIPIPH